MSKYDDSLRLKKSLIFANIALGVSIIILLIFGIIVVQPKQLEKASILQQYMFFDLTNKPQNTDVLLTEPKHDSVLAKESQKNSPEAYESVVNNSAISRKPRIAIIVTNLGVNGFQTERALSLPSNVALGFLPYISTLKPLLYKAKEDGHEIYFNLSFDQEYRHNYSLSSAAPVETNLYKLKNILSVCTGYNGVYINNLVNFNNQVDLINAITRELRQQKLILINKQKPFDPELALRNSFISPAVVIEHESDIDEIEKKLMQLVDAAKNNDTALAYIHGYAIAIDVLKEWLPTLKTYGVELVPVSALEQGV